jgi:hypothetical protein
MPEELARCAAQYGHNDVLQFLLEQPEVCAVITTTLTACSSLCEAVQRRIQYQKLLIVSFLITLVQDMCSLSHSMS